MEKFDELFEKLEKLNIIQKHGDWMECIPDDIWYEYLNNNFKEVKCNLYIDTHRWFETSITVIETCGGLLGVRYITNMFSESQDFGDCYHTIGFYKMEEIKVVSYKSID